VRGTGRSAHRSTSRAQGPSRAREPLSQGSHVGLGAAGGTWRRARVRTSTLPAQEEQAPARQEYGRSRPASCECHASGGEVELARQPRGGSRRALLAPRPRQAEATPRSSRAHHRAAHTSASRRERVRESSARVVLHHPKMGKAAYAPLAVSDAQPRLVFCPPPARRWRARLQRVQSGHGLRCAPRRRPGGRCRRRTRSPDHRTGSSGSRSSSR